MEVKTITKLYFILLSIIVLFLGSCVKNNNEPGDPLPSDRKPIALEQNNLVGTWEVYYYTKEIIDVKTNRKTEYRFTENDGFTVTFLPNGEYYEQNVFEGVTIEGTYELGVKSAASTKNDLIKLTHYVDSIKAYKTDSAYVPNLYEESFVYYHSYQGVAQKEKYKVSDVRYYRNKDDYKDYVDEDFKKVKITEEDLIGGNNYVWEFYKYVLVVETQQDIVELGQTKPIPPLLDSVANTLGEVYFFYKDEKDSQLKFRQINANESVVNMADGIVLINDDVINMKWEGYVKVLDKEGNDTGEKEKKVVTFKWWITEKSTTKEGYPNLKDYDEYRDVKDVLKDKSEAAYYRQVKWSPKASGRNFRSADGIMKLGVKDVATIPVMSEK